MERCGTYRQRRPEQTAFYQCLEDYWEELTYGDELNWHPHLHSLVSDVAWDPQGNSHPRGGADSETLSRLFQHHVLEMLVSERRLSREFAHRLRSWQHTGFQVHCGGPVDCEDKSALERLSAYVLNGIVQLERAIAESRPERAEPYFELAEAYRRTGQFEKSEEFYGQAMGRNPGLLESYRYLGEVLLRKGEVERAVSILEAGLKIKGQKAQILNVLGVAYGQLGRTEDSIEMLSPPVNSPTAISRPH